MPKYKSHLAGGFLTFTIIILVLQFFVSKKVLGISTPTAFLYLFFCLFGSLFPDIDTKSRIQKLTYLPLFFVIIASILLKNWILVSFLSIVALIPILANHRHLTHKIWFVTITPIIPLFLITHFNKNNSSVYLYCYVFFVAGALSHLFLDFGPKRFFKKF